MAVEENFDSALEKALQCLSHLGMSRESHTEQTKAVLHWYQEEIC